MNELMKTFLSLSASGSVIALILFVIKPVLKDRLSKTWQYYIWLIVIARMLLPFSLEVNMPYLERVYYPEQIELSWSTGYENAETALESVEKTTAASAKALDYWSTIKNYVWVLWIGMAILLFAGKLINYRHYVSYIKAGTDEIKEDGVISAYELACKTVGIKKAPKIYLNRYISSPMLVGTISPFIVIPSIKLGQHELHNIFIHELTHYKRLDIFYKWLILLTFCVHWYNPLVYFIKKETDKSCELSCDEMVIKTLDDNGKRSYGNTLLASLMVSSVLENDNKMLALSLNRDAKLLKERLRAIKKFRKKSKCTQLLIVVLTVAIVFGTAAMETYAADNHSEKELTSMVMPVPDTSSLATALSTPAPPLISAPEPTAVPISTKTSSDRPDYDQLAEAAYKKRMTGDFADIIQKVSMEKKEEIFDMAYEDYRVDFFAITASLVSDEKRTEIFERSKNEEKIPFTAILSNKCH